jgi:hypothetical protein
MLSRINELATNLSSVVAFCTCFLLSSLFLVVSRLF